MTNQTQNLYIVEDNAENSLNLKQFIKKKFNTLFKIYIFHNSIEALEKIDKNTTILILDYDYFGQEGNKIVNFVHDINPKTKVIILSNNEDIGKAIDDYRNTENTHILKNNFAPNKLFLTISNIAYYPVKLLVSGFGIGEMLAIFICCVLYIGLVVFLLLKILL